MIAFFGEDLEDKLYTNAHAKLSITNDKIIFVHNFDSSCAASYGAK